MSTRRHSDPLATFSHRIFQIKFVILELVFLLGFLAFVGDYISLKLKSATAREVSRDCTEQTHFLKNSQNAGGRVTKP